MRILMVIFLSALLSNTAIAAQTKRYDKNVVDLMTKKEWPEWNKEWIQRANSLIYKAADRVASSPECDKLSDIGVSEGFSVPNKKLSFFAECANGKRFDIADNELKDQTAARSETAKAADITDEQALASCEDAVKNALHHPSTFNLKSLSVQVYRAKWGNIATSFDFDAKNSFDLELKYHARCVIDGQGMESPEIYEVK